MRDHRQIRARWAAEAAAGRPVFIVGEARSGTSLLFRSLQTHSAFMPRLGLNLAESHAMELLPEVMGPECPPLPDLVAFMMDAKSFREFVEDIAPLRRRRELLRTAAPRLRQHPMAWTAAGEHHVVRRYFLGAMASRGGQRLLEKTPQHLPWVRHLRIAFPGARFLYVVRHPVDVFASYRRRFTDDPQGAAWADIHVSNFCRQWRVNSRTARVRAGGGRMGLMLVRYDELVGDPEPTLRRVLEYVGARFEQACMFKDAVESDWPSDPLLFGPIVRKDSTWRQHMSVDDAHQVERELSNEMAEMGFRPYTNEVG